MIGMSSELVIGFTSECVIGMARNIHTPLTMLARSLSTPTKQAKEPSIKLRAALKLSVCLHAPSRNATGQPGIVRLAISASWAYQNRQIVASIVGLRMTQ
jgi:hypothetical protein